MSEVRLFVEPIRRPSNSSNAELSARRFRRDDAADLIAAANNPQVSRFLRRRFPYPYTASDAEAFLDRALDVRATAGSDTWAICVDDRVIGGMGVVGYGGGEIESHCAELGYWLAEPWWGLGIARRANTHFMNYVWANIPVISRVYATILVSNQASRRVAEHLGMTCEGILAGAKQDRSNPTLLVDVALYALLRPGVLRAASR